MPTIPEVISATLTSDKSTASTRCNVCESESLRFDEATVLGRFPVTYFRCSSCGFIQTESPYWIHEAYSSAITSIDIGPLARSIRFSNIAQCLILWQLDSRKHFLDFGGGYGLFVRRMRDLGFDFRIYDEHCENIFAKGHEALIGSAETSFELITAIEVLEHLPTPVEVFSKLRGMTDNILFSTSVLPEPAPKIQNWWYYAPQHGQHISLFSKRALRILADRIGLNLYSWGDVHFMTTGRINQRLFDFFVSERFSAPIAYLLAKRMRVKSLLPADFRAISGLDLDA